MRMGRILAVCGVLACLPAQAQADPPPMAPGSSADGYPPTTNFTTSCVNKCESGRGGNAISRVIVLDSEGGKDATIATEQNDSGKSIHYFAANDGSVNAFVPESDTAYFACNYLYNQTSIGVMVEGFYSTPSSFGDLEYQRSAQLTAAIAHRYGFPIDATHVIPRGAVPDSACNAVGPDPSFDMNRLRSLAQAYLDEIVPPAITGPAPPSGTVGSPYTFTYSAANGPVTYAVTSGRLPDGLGLSADGVLSGTPTAGGSSTFTVTISRPSGVTASRTQTIAIAAPKAVLSTASLVFGTLATRAAAVAQAVSLTNQGDAPLGIGAVSVTGDAVADFTDRSNGCTGTVLLPSATCTIVIAFSPTATGARAATLHIDDRDPAGPQDVALSGTGVMPIHVRRPSVTAAGAVKLTLVPNIAGAATLRVTTRFGGRTVTVGVARRTARPGVALALTVAPKGRIKTALRRGRRIHAVARLVFRPRDGGPAVTSTRRVTLRLTRHQR